MYYIEFGLCIITTFLTIGTALVVCCKTTNIINNDLSNNDIINTAPHYCATIVDSPPKYEDLGTKTPIA
jgi:hypothetical protein